MIEINVYDDGGFVYCACVVEEWDLHHAAITVEADLRDGQWIEFSEVDKF